MTGVHEESGREPVDGDAEDLHNETRREYETECIVLWKIKCNRNNEQVRHEFENNPTEVKSSGLPPATVIYAPNHLSQHIEPMQC